jgi:hypothetical protein
MPFPTYQFRAVTTADLPLLREWLWRRHVREWWGDPVSGLARIAEHILDPAINPFMVECDEVPIGYRRATAPDDNSAMLLACSHEAIKPEIRLAAAHESGSGTNSPCAA